MGLKSTNFYLPTLSREGVLPRSTVGHSPTAVSEAQWEALQLRLPQPKWYPGGPGRKPMDLRRVIHGMVYVHKTGGQWRLMPTAIGHGHTL